MENHLPVKCSSLSQMTHSTGIQTSRWLDLPTEIYEDIFDLLPLHSTTTLLTCSLVCRDWIRLTRRRLFQYRTVLLKTSGPKSPYTLVKEDIVPNSTLLPNIQQIHVLAPAGNSPGSYDSLNKAIAMTRGNLPSLQRLRIFDVRWSLLSEEAKSAISSTQVTLLYLRCVVLENTHALGDLLSGLTSLEEVQLDGILFEKESSEARPASWPAAPPSLHKLHIHGTKSFNALQPWISSLVENGIRLGSILVRGTCDPSHPTADVAMLGKLIQLSGDKLEALSLIFTEKKSNIGYMPLRFDFQANNRLQYLEIGSYKTTLTDVSAFTVICDTLNSLPTTHHLSKLVFELNVPYSTPEELAVKWRSEWCRLDNALASLSQRREAFMSLKVRMPNMRWRPTPTPNDPTKSETIPLKPSFARVCELEKKGKVTFSITVEA